MLYLQTRPNPKEETRASTKRSACYWIRNSTHPDNHVRTSPEPFSRSKNIDSWGRGCSLRQESYTSDYSPTDTLYQRAAELWVSPCFSCMASFIWHTSAQTTSSGEDTHFALPLQDQGEHSGGKDTNHEFRRRFHEEVCEVRQTVTRTRQTTNNLKSCKQKIIVHFSSVCLFCHCWCCCWDKMCPLQEIITTLVK